ncbi:uncharacterized protein LOC113312247 [Papaver somniferum]|uniref:uncharacterized protein LOC113312247 n=1 Tax=Papaver somniferum TaxID=3469 RepID=UPI000E6F9EAC|nr:uncharacterized protein LOC113312247 [Papaver somniferum]
MVWVRFPGLSLEFWKEIFLFTICRELGTPIKVDNATINCEVGYYANVLVEMDFAESIPNKIWIGTKFGGFYQDVLIPECPKFCSSCKIVGHLVTECRVEEHKRKAKKQTATQAPAKNQGTKNDNLIPFDICDTSETIVEDSVIHSIQPTNMVAETQGEQIPDTGRFCPLNTKSINEKLVEESVIMEVPKFLKLTEDNALQNSVVKYVNGTTGKVTDESIHVTSWANVVEKEIVSSLVTSLDEKVGCRSPNKTAMLDFINCLNNCELIQAPRTGLQHSWSNCQHGRNRILCNLDRVVFNQQWLQSYSDWGYKVGLRMVSDHAPLLGGCANIPKPKNAPKKFQKMWISHLNFLQVVSECWLEDVPVEAQNEYSSREVQESTLLKQKSRTKWIKEGAANSGFFHANLKIRKARNQISEIEDSNGNIISDQNKIADELVQFFVKKFEFKDVCIDDSLLDVIPQAITNEDQDMLEATPSAEEIKNTIFDMDPESSPWHIIQEDFIKFIQFCWDRKFIPKGLNSNFLVLLPKVQRAKTTSQFRPIGLSNKIFTKIITTRLSSVMGKLISPQQAAYVKGRSIHEQVLLAFELVNEMKKKRRGGNVGLKLDISQAYDSIGWAFLTKVLLKYGFSSSWCNWILTLLQSTKISILINSGPCGFFSVRRGLKQGDPLSPLLFVLMEDVLSRNITQLVESGKLTPMVIRRGIHPTHMFFADDVFIFCNGAKKSLDNLMSLLDRYQSSSGQVINKLKRKCFVDGVCEGKKHQIGERINMEITKFPDKYLGIIIAPGRVKSSMVWHLVEIFQSKLAAWKGRLFSFQDRLVLIKSVLCSVPLYNMAIYRWPTSVIKICEKIMRNFLWSGDSEVRKFKTLSWKKMGMAKLKSDIRWCVGDGSSISIWFDTWYENSPIIDDIGLTNFVKANINMKVKDLLDGRAWNIPDELLHYFNSSSLPEVSGENDIMIWSGNIKGIFSTSSVVEKIRLRTPKVPWQSFIWKSFLHPTIASNIWKLQPKIYVDDDIMRKNGLEMVSRCCVCKEEQDCMNHTLWNCNFSVQIWSWICSIFDFSKPTSFEDICKAAQRNSPLVKEIWMTAACATMKELWFQRNKKLFEEVEPDLNSFKCRIWKLVHEGGCKMKGSRWGQAYDQQIIEFFKLGIRFSKYSCIKACHWSPPKHGYLLFCCDGSSFGNPRNAGFGIIVRDYEARILQNW